MKEKEIFVVNTLQMSSDIFVKYLKYLKYFRVNLLVLIILQV